MLTYSVDEDVELTLHQHDDWQSLAPIIQRNHAQLDRWVAWPDASTPQQIIHDDLLAMAQGRVWAWVVRYRGKVAGRVRLEITHRRQREGTLSFWLGKAFTGRQIMLRALHTILDWSYHELNLHRLCINAETQQTATIALAEQIGFQYEGTLQAVVHRAGAWRDWRRYSLLEDEWQPATQPIFGQFITDDVVLRLLQPQHAAAEYALIDRNRSILRPWFSWANAHTLETERVFIKTVLQAYAVGENLTLGLWRRDMLLGQLSLSMDLTDGHGQFGYFLDQAARGQGLMTRAVRRVMAWAFERRNLNRLWLRAGVDNKASVRVAERVGMQLEGVLQHENMIDGRWVNHASYSILASEWRARQRRNGPTN